jgi:hypothetical protein
VISIHQPLARKCIGESRRGFIIAFMTFFQVGAVNSGSKCARTTIMGLDRDIRNLLVAETSAFVSFYLTIKVLDLLSSHNCTKSRKEETR